MMLMTACVFESSVAVITSSLFFPGCWMVCLSVTPQYDRNYRATNSVRMCVSGSHGIVCKKKKKTIMMMVMIRWWRLLFHHYAAHEWDLSVGRAVRSAASKQLLHATCPPTRLSLSVLLCVFNPIMAGRQVRPLLPWSLKFTAHSPYCHGKDSLLQHVQACAAGWL